MFNIYLIMPGDKCSKTNYIWFQIRPASRARRAF